jgi:hypothetical protein
VSDNPPTFTGFGKTATCGNTTATRSAFSYGLDIEGDHERKKMTYYQENRRISAMFRFLGFGQDDYYDYYPVCAGFWKNWTTKKSAASLG